MDGAEENLGERTSSHRHHSKACVTKKTNRRRGTAQVEGCTEVRTGNILDVQRLQVEAR